MSCPLGTEETEALDRPAVSCMVGCDEHTAHIIISMDDPAPDDRHPYIRSTFLRRIVGDRS